MARRKKQDDEDSQENENIYNDNSDDTFGLPEVEYEPIKRDQTEEEPPVEKTEEPVYETNEYQQPEQTYYSDRVDEETAEAYEEHHEEDVPQYQSRYSYMEQNQSPVWPKVLLGILIFLIVGGAVYYFAVYQPGKEKERKAQVDAENRRKAAADEKKRLESLAEEQRIRDEQRRADSLASIKMEGSVETLSGRTGQYYVVVASAIDDDLLMDFANKLVKDGKQVKIIPPFGKKGKFHRLAVDAKDSYEEAQATADGMKGGEFGDQLWVVRY
jgi:DNA-binding transcriptional regulator YbjK